MQQTGEYFLNEQVQNVQVAVIGDMMTDRYIFGNVNRISPEAPVPVNLVTSQRHVLGGAANTAANLASLGCKVYAAGMIGEDGDGKILLDLMRKSSIDGSGLIQRSDYHTTTKVRILGARQQMLRLDFEEKTDCDEKEAKQIIYWLEDLLQKGVQCIVISDYGKGLITPFVSQWIIKTAKKYHVPVLVDPKGSDWTKYEGAYGITPNLKELSECVGYEVQNENEAVERFGKQVREKFQLDHLFVTRSEKGITSISENSIVHRASVAQDVFDVSGAGDTVMAVLAAATASKVDEETTLELANCAAGIAVSKVGTYQVKREEVLEAWKKGVKGKEYSTVLTAEEMKAKIRAWQKAGDVVVFTNGCFDILHRGHLTYLQKAASLGNHLVIGLNSDASVKRLKGEERPINTEEDRALMLTSLRFVDDVVIFTEDTPEKLLSELRPDILVKGGDYKAEEVLGREFVKKVEIIPFVDGYSTTHTISKIKGGNHEG